MTKELKKFTVPGTSDPVQVESAIRDGQGKVIDEEYLGHNGYDESAGVGYSDNASQLIPTIPGTIDKAPYLYRTSGGQATIGDRVNEQIVGGCIAVNQLVRNGNFENNNNWIISSGLVYSITNNTLNITLNGTYGSTDIAVIQGKPFSLNTNNKALLIFSYKLPIGFTNAGDIYVGGKYKYVTNLIADNNWHIYSAIGNFGSSDNIFAFAPYAQSSYSFNNAIVSIKNVMCFDLTQMFNSQIADYLATLTIDQALSKIKPWIDVNKYYAYNTGIIESVNLEKKIVTGVNQWDEETELGGINSDGTKDSSGSTIRSKNYIPCIPNTIYFAGSTEIVIHFYDINKQHIVYSGINAYQNGVDVSVGTFTTPIGACYMLFRTTTAYGTTYNHDICINLSWNGSRNGTYYPYEKHEYLMPSGELLGIPKLVNNEIEYDGDVYNSDGSIDEKYLKVDLGTLNWTRNTYYATPVFLTNDLSSLIIKTDSMNLKCTKYNTVLDAFTKDKSITNHATFNYGNIIIRDDSYTDATAFKSSLNGIYLICEKATPTTSQGTPYTNPQIVNDWGTEEFVTTNNVPVGHNSEYTANLRDKLQNQPNNAESDGLYLVKQTGSQQSLVSTTEITNPLNTKDTQLLNAIGGTLRQLLSISKNIDFAKTAFVDLGTLDFIIQTPDIYRATISNIKQTNDCALLVNISLTRKLSVYSSWSDEENNLIGTRTGYSYIYIKIKGYSDANAFKAAMAGVLFAYETN